jgi:hypothetical protein
MHAAAGQVALAEGNYADAVNHLEEDDSNAISMRALITAYDKNGQQGNAHRLSAKLAALNVPFIEQALVVPQFRKEWSAQVAAARARPWDSRNKY